MSWDCTGEPPPELITTATATRLGFSKALLIIFLVFFKLRAFFLPISPSRTITDTVGFFFTNDDKQLMVRLLSNCAEVFLSVITWICSNLHQVFFISFDIRIFWCDSDLCKNVCETSTVFQGCIT